MVIYADILLAVNWWIDYLLLCAVRRSAGLTAPGWRLALGAVTGAVTCLSVFLPAVSVWLSLAVKLGGALLMVAAAFPYPGWRRFLRAVILLFGYSAGLAGIGGALYYFAAPRGLYVLNGVIYYDIPPLILVLLTVVCYGIMCIAGRIVSRRAPRGHRYTVRIGYRGGTATLRCLYDSGQHLTEPFSGAPVLIAERSALAGLCPLPAAADGMTEEYVGWRLVPYSSIGGEGTLPAFLPDSMTVSADGEEQHLEGCYIAVCDSLGRGEYQGLIGTALGDRL